MSLNLLPPSEVKIVKYLFLGRYVVIATIILVSAELLLIISLLGMQLFLSAQYEREKKSIETQSKKQDIEEIKKAEKKINDFNSYLTRLDSIQKNHINWTRVVYLVTKHQTPEITINSLSMENGSQKVSVKGTAQTRESFLDFKEKLEKSGNFKDFNSPLSNIINPANISFSLEFKVNSETLKENKELSQ